MVATCHWNRILVQGSVKEKKNNINFFSCFFVFVYIAGCGKLSFLLLFVFFYRQREVEGKSDTEDEKSGSDILGASDEEDNNSEEGETDSFTFRKIHEEK